MKRPPAVAGQFYQEDPLRLRSQVEQYINRKSGREEAVGIVVPHAGLIYSGAVAGAVYSSIVFPQTFLMLGPNHTGIGPPVALMDSGEWEVPTGVVPIDRKLGSRILLNSPDVTADAQAHMFEHSLEVQLPFMTCISPDVRIVPIAIRSLSFDACRNLAEAIANAIQTLDYPVTILASSDMSHHLPDRKARPLDRKVIDKILALDPLGLDDTVTRERISMCGCLPVVIMLFACLLMGAKSARLVSYMTSGEISGDYENVVGYAGVVVTDR